MFKRLVGRFSFSFIIVGTMLMYLGTLKPGEWTSNQRYAAVACGGVALGLGLMGIRERHKRRSP